MQMAAAVVAAQTFRRPVATAHLARKACSRRKVAVPAAVPEVVMVVPTFKRATAALVIMVAVAAAVRVSLWCVAATRCWRGRRHRWCVGCRC